MESRYRITSCRDCQEKYEACHDHCEKYQKQRKERDEYLAMIKAARRKANEYDYYKRVRKLATRKVKKNKER